MLISKRCRNLKKFGTIFIFCIITLASYYRYSLAKIHFAHVDDIGVAVTILPKNYQHDEKVRQINNLSDPLYSSTKFKIYRGLDSVGLLSVFSEVNNALYAQKRIGLHWTYAPAQFFFTSFFLNSDNSYRDNLFWGRFPSLVFGILSIFLLFLVTRKYFNEDELYYSFVSVSMLSFSWLSVIYSAQMESYAVGLLCALIILFLFNDRVKNHSLSLKKACFQGIVLGALCWFQYQSILFMPAFWVASFYKDMSEKSNDLKTVLKFNIVSGLFLCAIFFRVYTKYLHLHSAGVNWNVGNEGQFLFNISNVEGLFSKVFYPFKFFVLNIFHVLNGNLGVLPESNPLQIVISLFYYFLIGLACYRFFKFESIRKNSYALLFTATFGTWAIFILAQKLTLSPTRHLLMLLPMIIFLIIEGVGLVFEKLQVSHKNRYFICLGWSLLLTVSFASGYGEQKDKRKDQFETAYFEKLIKKYHVDFVVQGNCTYNLSLMRSITNLVPVFRICGSGGWSRNPETKAQRILFADQLTNMRSLTFDSVSRQANRALGENTNVMGLISDYKVLYKHEVKSLRVVSHSKLLGNGTNGLFVYILEHI